MSVQGYRTARSFIAFAAALATLVSRPALAQIEEVVVTAQKRTQSLQDIPLSVTAFDAEAIWDAGFQSVEDIAADVPNLYFQDNGLVSRFSLRGVNLNTISDASESPIAIYMDGIYLGSTSNFRIGLFDLERIEVIRGPQGTLYGRNSTGGLADFHSKAPTAEFEGYTSVQYGRFDKLIVEAAMGGPLSESVRFRASIKSDTDNGYQTNLDDGTDWWKSDLLAGRLQLAADFGEDVELLLSWHGWENGGVGPGYGLFGNRDPADPTLATVCSMERILGGECVSRFGEQGTNDPTRLYSNNFPSGSDRDQWGALARLTWQLSETLTFTSLTGYEELSKLTDEDGDAGRLDNQNVGSDNDYDQLSQEFQLNGVMGKVDWVAGLYYFESTADVIGRRRIFGTRENPGVFRTLSESTVDTESWAMYGDVQYAVSDVVSLSGGIRFTSEDKSHAGVNYAPLLVASLQPKLPVPFDFDISEDAVTWRAAVDWHLSDDVMTYGSVSTGFKSPGFQTQFIISASPEAAGPSDREEITAYEIGLKSRWLDGELQLNGAAFYYDYEGLQQILSITMGDENFPQLSNMEQADIFGIELELQYFPSDRFELAAFLGTLDSEISDPDPQFDGNDVAVAPSFNYGITANYHIPIVNRGTLTLQASYRWQDDLFFAADNDPLEVEGSYGLLDARIMWKSAGGKYAIDVFGDNLTDEEYLVHSFTSGRIGGGVVGIWGVPRTYGIRGTLFF